MAQVTSYRYKAIDEDSYNSLAAYAITLPATVTLHPGFQTIVISENATQEVGEFIDSEGLSFHIAPIEVDEDNFGDLIDDPVTDPDTLRVIINQLVQDKAKMAAAHRDALAEITRQKDAAKKEADLYQRCFSETNSNANRVREQVEAIAVLINAIFPKS